MIPPCINNAQDFALACIIFGLIDVGILALTAMFIGTFHRELDWLFKSASECLNDKEKGVSLRESPSLDKPEKPLCPMCGEDKDHCLIFGQKETKPEKPCLMCDFCGKPSSWIYRRVPRSGKIQCYMCENKARSKPEKPCYKFNCPKCSPNETYSDYCKRLGKPEKQRSCDSSFRRNLRVSAKPKTKVI